MSDERRVISPHDVFRGDAVCLEQGRPEVRESFIGVSDPEQGFQLWVGALAWSQAYKREMTSVIRCPKWPEFPESRRKYDPSSRSFGTNCGCTRPKSGVTAVRRGFFGTSSR